MKNLLTIIFSFCWIFAFAQSPTPPPQPKKATTIDFDFTFYPEPTYGKLTHLYKKDSLSGADLLEVDSSKGERRVVFEKKGDLFSISPLSNISSPTYTAHLSLVGSLTDGAFLYRKDEAEKELVIVNPMKGYAVIIYRECKDVKGQDKRQCDYINHYFGNVPFGTYQ